MTNLAVVTGATGMIGKRIVDMLLNRNFTVRILTRDSSYNDQRVEVINGSLNDPHIAKNLLQGAGYLFHCAAELNDETKMWETNVNGTENLMRSLEAKDMKYICYLSSVGVIGKFEGITANEKTICSPLNMYEKSKLAAEEYMQSFKSDARVIILRPTNVVDRKKNALNGLNKKKIFLKGGENAHIVHAEDVAAAAIYFMDHSTNTTTDCFIVSYDNEKMNTIAGCFALCNAIKNNTSLDKVKPYAHLPWTIPYLIRRILKGPCNRSDVSYSPDKLLSTGFKYPRGFIGTLKDICENT